MRVIAATALFAAVHSLLASRQTKVVVRRSVGNRAFSALYRPLFVVQSFVTVGALALYVLSLPDRTLWVVRGAPATLLRGAQGGAVLFALAAMRQIGLRRFLGVPGLLAWLRSESQVPEPPPAQGPAPDRDGEYRPNLPFRVSRHPLNLAPLVIFWGNPTMTVRLASFAAAATIYNVWGSRHEERLHEAAAHDAYACYREGAPFLLPLPSLPAGAGCPWGWHAEPAGSAQTGGSSSPQ